MQSKIVVQRKKESLKELGCSGEKTRKQTEMFANLSEADKKLIIASFLVLI